MKKAIKEVCAILLVVSAIVLAMIESGKLLNVKKSDNNMQNVKDITAKAGGGLTGSGNCDAMYYFVGGETYCGAEQWALSLRKSYSESEPILPDNKGTSAVEETVNFGAVLKSGAIPQSIAYAKAHGASQRDIQLLVWASWQFGGVNRGTSTRSSKLS